MKSAAVTSQTPSRGVTRGEGLAIAVGLLTVFGTALVHFLPSSKAPGLRLGMAYGAGSAVVVVALTRLAWRHWPRSIEPASGPPAVERPTFDPQPVERLASDPRPVERRTAVELSRGMSSQFIQGRLWQLAEPWDETASADMVRPWFAQIQGITLKGHEPWLTGQGIPAQCVDRVTEQLRSWFGGDPSLESAVRVLMSQKCRQALEALTQQLVAQVNGQPQFGVRHQVWQMEYQVEPATVSFQVSFVGELIEDIRPVSEEFQLGFRGFLIQGNRGWQILRPQLALHDAQGIVQWSRKQSETPYMAHLRMTQALQRIGENQAVQTTITRIVQKPIDLSLHQATGLPAEFVRDLRTTRLVGTFGARRVEINSAQHNNSLVHQELQTWLGRDSPWIAPVEVAISQVPLSSMFIADQLRMMFADQSVVSFIEVDNSAEFRLTQLDGAIQVEFSRRGYYGRGGRYRDLDTPEVREVVQMTVVQQEAQYFMRSVLLRLEDRHGIQLWQYQSSGSSEVAAGLA